jgi:hydroxyethylthiazole kinase-like uncharacterized protein yjeF
MMRIATVSESQKIDQFAQEKHGLSGEILMESAGALAAHEVRATWTSMNLRGWVAVVCGSGGNGADGLVVARHLASAHDLYQLNFKRLPSDVRLKTADDVAELSSASLIVDALFGLGLTRNVHGTMKLFIDQMNESAAPTVSLDVPSGLDADRGECLGASVEADMTLTFGLAKRGFFVAQGPHHVGRLKILPIGFPSGLVRSIAYSQTAFGEKSARKLLPKRSSASNKSSHGRVAVFAGRPGMIGAALLAGLGASRSGAGYVTLITHLSESDKKAKRQIADVAPEFLSLASDARDLWEKTQGSAAIVGPGFGVGDQTLKILRELQTRKTVAAVVDADALSTLADEKKNGRDLPLLKTWILTPHAGELAKLIGGHAKDLEANRFESAERAARELGAIVLFKGFRTVVSNGDRSCVILSGNSALAKAGSGDILSGLIGGFLAQGLEPFDAACLGAYVHGRLADEWLASGRDILSLQPSDIAKALPFFLKALRTSKAKSDLRPDLFQ